MRELKLISLDEYKEYQELKEDKKKFNEAGGKPIVSGEMMSKTNEIITNNDGHIIKDVEIDTNSNVKGDDEKFEKIMPPPGLPVKNKIGLKRLYLETEQGNKIYYKRDNGIEWIKKWRKRF